MFILNKIPIVLQTKTEDSELGDKSDDNKMMGEREIYSCDQIL
jgi:hypothetical protein